MITGNPKNVMDRLQPINEDIAPKTNVPTIAPIEFIELIHDNSSLVIGLSSGVLSDRSIGSAGDSQPTTHL